MITDSGKIRLLMELRSQGITDTRVLSAIETTPRECFVPAELTERAWENTVLPIGDGQTISQPIVVATMSQKLEVGARMRVLEVGTGSGYQAAILARLARRVYTIERHRDLLRQAQERFDRLDLHNITTRLGDGARGWPEQAPFDRIVVTAAAAQIPTKLVEQLAPGGIMVLPVGADSLDQRLLRLRKTDDGLEQESLMDVRFVPLVEGDAEARPRR